MDENKRTKLKEIGYSIRPCCALCKHGKFSIRQRDRWGTCKLHEYTHLKHTGIDRQLSIHQSGHCRNFELNNGAASTFGSYGAYLTVIQ